MYYIILYYIVLYYIILDYIILYFIILYYILLYLPKTKKFGCVGRGDLTSLFFSKVVKY